MKNENIYKIAFRIVENAIRRTNWEGSSDCSEYYFSDDEVAQYLMDTFYDEDLIDIYRRLEDGEFVLIKELCNEYFYFEMYITIGKYAEEETYCLYSQYNQDYADRYCK